MATIKQKRTENVPGDFYVDASCIDCDTCRWMAPDVFDRQNSQTAVYQQPQSKTERLLALQALLSCPTASIGTIDKPTDIKQVQQTFPLLVADNVYHCGYHAENSFGAASYFIQREAGNILVDSPRFTSSLAKQLEKLGGVRYLYLTHRDDVADHQKFHQHFNCERILHLDDIQESTQEVEIKLSGTETVELAPDLTIIPVPEECVLIYPSSQGIGMINFTLHLIKNGDGLLTKHTIDLLSLKVFQEGIEALLLTKIRRDQSIIFIGGVREKIRIEKLFEGKLLQNQQIIAVSAKKEWFSEENPKLAGLIGGTTTGNKALDEEIRKELPCQIPPQERQKINSYIRAKGLEFKTLSSLANSLWFITRKINNTGINDAILAKKFNW